MMRARIYRPSKTAMQSGSASTKKWVLEFTPSAPREIDPLMGWTSSGDTQSQVLINFESKEAAIDFARKRGIEFAVVNPKSRRPIIRKRGYAENFAFERRDAWTH